MKTSPLLSLTATLSLACLSISFCNTKAAKKETMAAKRFTIVELFTSEGCSSCPPADEAMIRLSKEFPEDVYFLGYHVDYWDYLGWKDEFSNADYTDRQQRYSTVFGANSIYTPEAIVNGEKELVGSRENELKNIIEQDLIKTASSTPAPVTINLTAKNIDPETISTSYKISNAGKTTLNIALVQLKATSSVKRGENEGRTLNHINIVRWFKTIPFDKDVDGTLSIKIPAGMSAKDFKIIAFVQDEKYLKIGGAVETVIE